MMFENSLCLKTATSSVGSQCIVSITKSVEIQQRKISASKKVIRVSAICADKNALTISITERVRKMRQLHQRVRQANQMNIVFLAANKFYGNIIYYVMLYSIGLHK